MKIWGAESELGWISGRGQLYEQNVTGPWCLKYKAVQ